MSSTDSEDDLIAYGTPLEPLEEDEIPKKRPCSIEDQVVKDKQGRRRFHGAFTGGFSAGFFNTVGSLEGWTPSSFKSSKSNKQQILHQKPEDFMDEEDVSEFGISPVVLKAKTDYVTANKRKFPDFSCSAAMLGTFVMNNILQPVRETLGIKLLKKMGWKPGQGVGPPLRKHVRKSTMKAQKKQYGCELPPGTMEGQSDDPNSNSDSDGNDVEFTHNDYEPFLCQIRSNFYGIGYKGLDKTPVLGSTGKGIHKEEKNATLRFGSQAFGVGAFEEEDEDIYSKDDMSRYDFSLGGTQPKNIDPHEKDSLKLNETLEGFVRERKKTTKKYYPLPLLPKDFKPVHRILISRFDKVPSERETFLKKPALNSQDRRFLIGEISEELQEREKREVDLTKELISNVKINTNKFKPFSQNPAKQERYENYLKLIHIGKKDHLSHLQPLIMSESDKERERIEFEKAALLFKPLTGAMEERFSTASQPDDFSDPLAVVERFHSENDDRREAAKMKLYGSLTRRTEDWTPCQLLCKRFNIPEPRKSHGPNQSDVKADKKSFHLFDVILKEKQVPESAMVGESSHLEDNKKSDCAASELTEKNFNEVQDKIDIFREIFLASDDEEIKEEHGIDRKRLRSKDEDFADKELLYEEKVINSKRNLSPPSGIFENINLESLALRNKNNNEQVYQSQHISSVETQTCAGTDFPPDVMYGPKIPHDMTIKTTAISIEPVLDDNDWIEKKTHKKQKKNKKSKKSSHKSKHKHKKHKR